jgi:hypothetical protein
MTGSAKQSIWQQVRMDCFVALLLAMTEINAKKRPPALLPTDVFQSIERIDYFGYLNSGAAFSASLVVFIDASHLSFLES